MARVTDIVVTTIFEPAWLQGYLDNLRAHGRERETTLRIICDRKTPATVYEAAAAARKQGFRIDCPSLEEQSAWVRGAGLPEDFIPWDTDNRRNIGFLRAWESGAEVLISIDDDNYCLPDSDFVGSHHVVGRRAAECGGHLLAQGEWFNICTLLEPRHADEIYPRGYPYAERGKPAAQPAAGVPEELAQARVAVNAGLWLNDPDVDAITRLAQRPRMRQALSTPVLLGPRTWSPVNTQNTALLREAMPAYYYVRMGFPLQGMRIDRFGDILSGYFIQKCAKHLGELVRVGSPVAEHKRSPHNLFKDLYHELAGMVVVEELLPWLREVKLSGGSYAEAYAALADAIDAQAPKFRGFVWDQGGRDFLVDSAACMRTWLGALRRLHS
ncbi:MAG TPA: hypothetical protein VFA75_07050 [Nevskia sp.]|nr:hypothetical protein [Nevskia sp.]